MPGTGGERGLGGDRQVHRGQLRDPDAPLTARPPDPSRRITAARLANQQLVRPRFTRADEVVAWFGAVQAQDYRGSLWAVGQRLASNAAESDVEAAIESRAIVRTWPMRETLHFVAAADARWMLGLLAPRLLRRNVGRYRQLELDAAALVRSRKVLTRALTGGARLTRAAAYAALQRAGVSPAGQRGIHIISHLAQEGVLCFGCREDKQPTFVLLEEWVPPAPEVSRPEALARLAIMYFRGHGPATFRDFAWWAGLVARDATAAVAEAGTALVRETSGGNTYFTVPGVTSRRLSSAALLPPWDEYLVAYKDRSAALGHLPGEPPPMVIGKSLLVLDGRVRGTWSRAAKPSSVVVAIDFWSSPTSLERRAATRAAERYGRFVGKKVEVSIRSDARMRP